MRVAGIDCSSFAIDVVTVPWDDEGEAEPIWLQYRLRGSDAFERTRSVPDVVPGRTHILWDEVLAFAIEEPTGKWKPGAGFRVQGAVLTQLPVSALVMPLQPAKWRRLVGLRGNCSKQAVFDWVAEQIGGRPRSQDAADAYCMALAMRRLLKEEQDGKRAA